MAIGTANPSVGMAALVPVGMAALIVVGMAALMIIAKRAVIPTIVVNSRNGGPSEWWAVPAYNYRIKSLFGSELSCAATKGETTQ